VEEKKKKKRNEKVEGVMVIPQCTYGIDASMPVGRRWQEGRKEPPVGTGSIGRPPVPPPTDGKKEKQTCLECKVASRGYGFCSLC
jgi:hypothetical protein